MKLKTEANRVRVGDRWWSFSTPVSDAIQIGDRVFVIFDSMRYPSMVPARNLRAYDLDKNELWAAALPTEEPAAAYIHFLSESPLTAWNFACFRCVIDEASGLLIETHFTK